MAPSALAHPDPYFRAQLTALKPASVRDTKAMIGNAALKLFDARSAKQAPKNSVGHVSKDVTRHSVPPHNEKETTNMRNEMSSVSNWNFLRSPTVPSVKVRNTAERVQFALQAWGRGKPAPIKQIQHIAGVDQKTASAWFNGKQPPRADHLLTLALHIPELKAEIARLLELEQDHAESFQREAIALLQRYAK